MKNPRLDQNVLRFLYRILRVDRVPKKLTISEYNKAFSLHSSGKFKNFLLRKFFETFQNGGDICSGIYVVKTRIFCPVYQVKL